VASLELEMYMDVMWLQDSSYLFICVLLYDASINWLASNTGNDFGSISDAVNTSRLFGVEMRGDSCVRYL
jgi:hypothetical protein